MDSGINEALLMIMVWLICFVTQGFVLAVTMVREAVDEVRRYQRDKEMNSQLYSKLTVRGQWEDWKKSIHTPPHACNCLLTLW